MTPEKLKNIIEVALMANDEPRTVAQLQVLFEGDNEQPQKEAIREVINQLIEDYEGRGIELKEIASGFRFQARSEYADWLNRLFQDRPQRYSRAFLETLAIIAYRQPVTRGEIEDIRGVSVNTNIIKSLQEREWIRVVGHRDVPGKPELLATTREFLDYFNLKKLSELPPLSDIKDYDQLNSDLFEGLDIPPPGNEAANEGVNPGEQSAESPVDAQPEEKPQDQSDDPVPDTPEEQPVESAGEDNVVPFSN
jgi:segregation and condensation protein B